MMLITNISFKLFGQSRVCRKRRSLIGCFKIYNKDTCGWCLQTKRYPHVNLSLLNFHSIRIYIFSYSVLDIIEWSYYGQTENGVRFRWWWFCMDKFSVCKRGSQKGGNYKIRLKRSQPNPFYGCPKRSSRITIFDQQDIKDAFL